MSPTVAASVPFAPGHLGASETLVVGLGKRPRAVAEDMRITSCELHAELDFHCERGQNTPTSINTNRPQRCKKINSGSAIVSRAKSDVPLEGSSRSSPTDVVECTTQ